MDTHDIAAAVRSADYDRYLSVLFAPAQVRGRLLALYAFNHEIAKVAEAVSQPMAGFIRLQWWRDAVEEIYSGRGARRHEAAEGLARAVTGASLPRPLIDAMLDARERDLEPSPFANLSELESYADAASGNLMRLAARILGAGETLDAHARELGIAYAYAGLLRALPFHAARRRLMLPRDHLIAAVMSEQDVFAGGAPLIRTLMDGIAAAARARLAAAPASALPRRVLPALLPAALVRPYLRVMGRARFDPYRNPAGLSVPRRQLAMLSAMMRGRI